MPVIKLTHNDINEMVRRTVHSVLSESVREVMGSAMAEKEDVIQELVDYVEKEWEQIKKEGRRPNDTGTWSANVGNGTGTSATYIILPDDNIAKKLGIADKFDMNIAVTDYQVSPKLLGLFGANERGTEGTTYHGKDSNGVFYGEFSKPTFRIKHSRIDLYVPAINGELQTQGLYSTLYHELNHNVTGLGIKQYKVGQKDNQGKTVDIDKLNPVTATRRTNDNPHFRVQAELKPDPMREFLQGLMFGPEKEEQRTLNFLFYAVWETTERNARAEEMYGDLQAMNAKREDFNNIYPQTTLYRNLKQYNEMLDKLRNLPSNSKVWDYAANVMNMKEKDSRNRKSQKSFNDNVKERFISRTEELMNVMYRKGMKVAELYFQRHGPQPEKSRLEQYKERKKAEDEDRKVQNLLRAIFGRKAER